MLVTFELMCAAEIGLAEHEKATIKAFVVRERQERFLSFVSSAKNRHKFTRDLPNFRWFDKRYASSVKWNPDPKLELWNRHVQGISNIAQLLRSKGAGRDCWVMSDRRSIDGQLLPIEDALEEVVGSDSGAILSCILGRLAFFAGDGEMLLLARQ